MSASRLAIGAAVLLIAHPATAQARPSQVLPAEIVVIAPTPLSDNAKDTLASSVQTVSNEEIEASHAAAVTDYLRRMPGGVFVNDIQNNPLQPDINYRGFTASPLLGTAQGLSLYMDGVRLNQPFGEVVSWDLIPKSAIRSLTLVPGSNPLFGRNSLGGALSIQTKDGKSDPGAELEVNYGSFRRRTVEAQVGGRTTGGVDWFTSGNGLKERGWRNDSPSQALQLFAKLGWSDTATRVALSGSFADSDLNGNGLQEMRLLKADRSSVYTHPDNTKNLSGLLNLTARQAVSDRLSVSGSFFWRKIRTRSFNGDVNDDALGEDLYQPDAAERAALAAAGYMGFPVSGETQASTPFPRWRCIANVLLDSEPNEKCNGLANRTGNLQSEWGVTGEVTLHSPVGSRDNTLTLGLVYVRSDAHFRQTSQFGFLTPEHGIVPVQGPGAFADGSQQSLETFDARVDLAARTKTFSLYALDSIAAGALRIDLSARYDSTAINNRDAITPGSGRGSLDADQRFVRLNPALMLRYTTSKAVTIDAAVAETSRAPSAIELGCADPESPCRLPNAFAGDPPLDQVVARTIEGGIAMVTGPFTARIGVFRTVSRDDILFVADDTAGFGYFRNFGTTRRQGFDIDLAANLRRARVTAHYTYLDATYQSSEKLNGSANSSAEHAAPGFEGGIEVARGDRIPLIPRHIFKACAAYDLASWASFSLDMIAVAGTIARGNENGAHQADGIYYLGPGKTRPYAVFNAGIELRALGALTLFAQVDNVLDKQYATAAQLGATAFDRSGAFVATPFLAPAMDGQRPRQSSTFYAPGAARSVQVGIKGRF